MSGAIEIMEGYPIGQQDFCQLRKDRSIYVDKTMYIEKILRRKNKYLFLARPHRFGKSLFLSTLRYFFEGRRELFRGLDIDRCDWEWHRYPVLYLDLNPLQYEAMGDLDTLLNNIFRRWEAEYDVEVFSDNISTRFSNIISAAHKKTRLEVVILVDEYDKPLVCNLNNDQNFEYYRIRLASIYSNLKSSAEHIKLAFLTGVSRFSKLSVFSDLNNLNDISFDEEYADICGITEAELQKYFSNGISRLAEEEMVSVEEANRLLKQNYDGYKFARKGSEIYNPWSVLCCMEKRHIGSYWVRTGLPKIVAESLRFTDADIESIVNTECTLEMLQSLDLKTLDPLALLYQTGYLTIKSYDREARLYQLGIPNKEVTEGLFNVLLPYYVGVRRVNPEVLVSDIIKYLRRGEPEKMLESIDIFLASVPYDMKMENENNLHNAIYILLRLIGTQVETEVHTSNGRMDLVIKTGEYLYVIELKYGHESKLALNQIRKKEYDMPFRSDSRRLYRIGVNFNPETRRLDSPEIEEVG